jgi:predicted enzyme related to lactoylglutathione lyase
MPTIFLNIDVDDLERATAFYCDGLGFRVGRRLGDDFRELLGAGVPVYFLVKRAHTQPFAGASSGRTYERHWTPVHMDFVVDDLEAARDRASQAGARIESEITSHAWGRMVLCSDPFGNGFCLLEMNERGYDALT